LACELTTKQLAGRPAAIALLRNVRLLSRSPAAFALALVALTVSLLTALGFGLVCTSRPAIVALLHVYAPPVRRPRSRVQRHTVPIDGDWVPNCYGRGP